MSPVPSTCGLLHCELVRIVFLHTRRETDRFFTGSGVHHTQSNQFHYRREVFFSHVKSKVGNILAKTVTLCINLNIDGELVTPRSHTHPSHYQTSLLLTSSLSLCIPSPHTTQCM